MREIDLLLREFASGDLLVMDEEGVNVFDSILDYDDQKLFDYIFKGVSLSNDSHEIFIDKHLKNLQNKETFNSLICLIEQGIKINEKK
tara:strand:- start:2761 stop:3024 length:264 start_codon:yes stop_codon:yes gene_type:complete